MTACQSCKGPWALGLVYSGQSAALRTCPVKVTSIKVTRVRGART